MARPRKQTYTLQMYLDKIRDRDIRSDQDVQRLSGQWKNNMINELIVSVLTDSYIPPIILGQEQGFQLWVVDGLQRSSSLFMFRYGNYRITSSIEEPIIKYRAKVKDTDGEVLIDENGDIVWKDAEFNIKGKTYDNLPEELKKRFNEYQIETVIHENYDIKRISKLVRLYNNHVNMNIAQKSFTFVDNYARDIREILRNKFFVNCKTYTENERTKGTLERLVMESVMCIFHFNEWKKGAQIGSYLNENASMEEFATLNNELCRLEEIMTEDLYSLFTVKDSFIWFALFHKFTFTGLEDGKFSDFLKAFQEGLCDYEVDGMQFYTVDKGHSTKDKAIIGYKLNILETLMCEYLNITKEDLAEVEILDFIRENANPDATEEDLKLYEDMLNTFACKVDSESELLESYNKPSMLAIIAYSCIEEIDLDSWLVDYINKNDTYFKDQVENFQYMKYDLEDFKATERISESA